MKDVSSGGVLAWAGSTGGATGRILGPDATLRQSFRLAVGGEALRLRFTNHHAYSPLEISHVTVAPGTLGELVHRPPALDLLVEGDQKIIVQPGRTVWTDWLQMPTTALCTLVVSIYVGTPMEIIAHDWANRITMATLSSQGDHTHDLTDTSFRPHSTSWCWVDAAEVRTTDALGALVVVGDSITDGAGADFGTETRWTDFLAERMHALPPGDVRRRSVINAGIGGNTLQGIGNATVGLNVVSRLERDALTFAKVADVLVFAGTNDLYLGRSASEVITSLDLVAAEIRRGSVRPLVSTLIGRIGGYGWTDVMEKQRLLVNDWIRDQDAYDSFIDLDSALREPQSGRMSPAFDADGTHPNTTGNRAMAGAVALDLFADPWPGQG